MANVLGYKDFNEMISSNEKYMDKFLDGLKDGQIITINDPDEDD